MGKKKQYRIDSADNLILKGDLNEPEKCKER